MPLISLVDDGRLGISFLPGSTEELVVAFTGIGHQMGGLQAKEFMGTASRDATNNVLFVVDRERSWFSSYGLVDRIAKVVLRMMQDVGAAQVSTIGNSMGGYGAVLFSGVVPVRTAVAFVPQFSLDPEVVDDPRWPEFRPFLVRENHRPLSSALNDHTTYFVIYGARDAMDAQHRAKFSGGANLHICTVHGAGHNVVERVKAVGLLGQMVGDMFDHRLADLTRTVRDVEARLLN